MNDLIYRAVLYPFLLMGLFFFSTQKLSGQKDQDFNSWVDFNYSYIASPKWTFGGDGGTRGILTSDEFSTIYLRPSASFKVNKDISLNAAIAGFQTFRSGTSDLFEFRLAQQVQATWPRLDRIYFTHRLRNEERFYFEDRFEDAPENDSNFENRLRYRLGVETNYFNVTSKIGNVKLLAGAEYFETFQSRTDSRRFNDSRISAGFGQLLKKGWSYSLLFIWQRSRDVFGDEFTTDQLVLRLRVYLKRSTN
ncbi:DUF2490 domain-containing protein [Cryomorphaceae bacterium 1068]|nr:DUF2490 domain-containing protein [Cryomorphaceae bacterium 1068]